MEKGIIMFIILIGLTIAFIILFVMQIKTYRKHLIEPKISILDVACAGSPLPDTPEKIKFRNLSSQKFFTQSGDEVKFSDYRKFYVQGWSMLLCGIKNNDILFTKSIKSSKITKLQLTQPKVLVLKREGKSLEEAITKGDYAKYKVRRAWAILPFDEEKIMAKVDEIMQSEIFLNSKKAHPENFLSNEEIKIRYREKCKTYQDNYSNCTKKGSKDNLVVLATTLRKIGGESKVFFSIHPAQVIEAEVIYAFHKEETHVS